jgi:hypothetical protein
MNRPISILIKDQNKVLLRTQPELAGGTPGRADYHDFTMENDPEFAQDPADVDGDASEISEGSSIGYGAPPGRNKANL